MYVAIDRENLNFLYKHDSFYALSQLVWIQNPGGYIDIQPCDDTSFLHLLSDYELKILYENTTGVTSVYYRERLRAAMMEIVSRMEVIDVNLRELEAQADSIVTQDKPMKYVRGSSRPTELLELFPFRAEQSPDELKFANLGARVAVALYGAIPAPPSAVQPPPSALGATLPSTNAPRSRSAGVRETIWAVADELWEQNGKPTDIKDILALRKRIMVELEEKYAVKRNTSSNELGNWQRAKFS